jgi:hypothetical protein
MTYVTTLLKKAPGFCSHFAELKVASIPASLTYLTEFIDLGSAVF